MSDRILTRAVRPRTAKLLRDLRLSGGRVIVMVIAIAVAVTGFGAILITREALVRDSSLAYRGTNPAAATLDVPGGVDAGLLADIRALPGVDDATARQTVATRVKLGEKWLPMLLFVVPTDDSLRIAHFATEEGVWPASAGGVFLERAAAGLLGADTGDSLTLERPDGTTTTVEVEGRVWDAALPPANQERTGYGFATPALIEELGFTASNENLLITIENEAGQPSRDQPTVDRVAASVSDWLRSNGHEVHEISAPPYQHPHQNQTDTITNLLVAFALASLALAAVLVASTLGGMLAAQSRAIGIMKTVGATRGAIMRLYASMTLVVAVVATAIALLPAWWLGSGLARLVGSILNIDVSSLPPTGLTLVTIAAAGIVIPVVVALAPIVRAARVSVREALDELDVRPSGGRRIDRLLARMGGGERTSVLALRNLLRRPRRLVATVALLAAGGALFLAGINASAAWSQWVDDGLNKRSYDVQLTFAEPVDIDRLDDAIRSTATTSSWEPLQSLHATPASATGGAVVQRIYPDGGHGSFSVTGIDPQTALVHFDVRSGHWLREAEPGTVVVNQGAYTRLGDPAMGSEVTLAIEGHAQTWTLVGVVDEVAGPATAYVALGALDASVIADGEATTARLVLDEVSSAQIERLVDGLDTEGIEVQSSVPTTELRNAIDQHVTVFIAVLITLALLMAAIGALGLASTMTVSVLERTREFGIMKAIGARSSLVGRMVLIEGMIAGAAGFVLATVVSIPATVVVGSTLGRLAFGIPLPLTISAGAIAVWLAVALAVAAVSSASAAARSARLTVRQSISYQ